MSDRSVVLAAVMVAVGCLESANAFGVSTPALARIQRHGVLSHAMAAQKVGKVGEIPAGERKFVKVGDEDVMVVNHKGSIYALSPKCPHLGLPMKTGEISDDGPCITCKFHGSKFDLNDGKAVAWTESVMGIPGTQFLGNIMGNVGGAKNSPAKVFSVEVDADGAIVVDTSKVGRSGCPA